MNCRIKLIIAGSRDFKDYPLLKNEVDNFIGTLSNTEIVSGTAAGADQLGERYAQEHNIPIKRFPANWELHGKKAGYLRNVEMAEYATRCICFWDGKSKGTKMMIDICKEKEIFCVVIMTKSA